MSLAFRFFVNLGWTVDRAIFIDHPCVNGFTSLFNMLRK